MGYSCSTAASLTLDAIGGLIRDMTGGNSSNGMPDGGFYEIGREQPDGAITGTVWKPNFDRFAPPNSIRKRGSFKIASDGKVVRFPGLTRNTIKLAFDIAQAEYRGRYGTWQEQARAMLDGLKAGKAYSYSWYENVARMYQRSNKVMFLIMPASDPASLQAALEGMLAPDPAS